MKIISKDEAKAQGLKRYYTGLSCTKGHDSERHISGHCIECMNDRSSIYYENNKDDINKRNKENYNKKEYNKEYNSTHKDKLNKRSKEYYLNNKEKLKLQAKEYYINNKEKALACGKTWYLNNKSKMKIYMLEYCKQRELNNPYRKWFDSGRSRKKILGKDFQLTWEETEEILKSQSYCCAITKLPFWTKGKCKIKSWDSPSMDRIIHGGVYSKDNVRIILDCVNAFRGRMPDEKMLEVAKIIVKNLEGEV